LIRFVRAEIVVGESAFVRSAAGWDNRPINWRFNVPLTSVDLGVLGDGEEGGDGAGFIEFADAGAPAGVWFFVRVGPFEDIEVVAMGRDGGG